VDDIRKAAVAEFIATFALIFIGAGASVLNANGQLDLTGVALAHGLALGIMVSITAPISGGFANPAVATSLWVTGKLSSGRTLALVVAGLLGAIAGAYVLKGLIPRQMFDAAGGGTPGLSPGISAGKGILIEAVLTFFLLMAVYGTWVDDRGPFVKSGFAIGLVVAFDIMAFGPYTGAATNPARWFGPALAAGQWANWYVWIVGPLAGGIIGGVAYWYAFLKDTEPATP
jgi:aquaporin Z